MIHTNESATFAALIEARMQALGINQVELERRSGITDTSWAGWRAGRLPAIKAFLPLIAMTLEIGIAELADVIEQDRAARPKTNRRRVGIPIDTPEDARAWIAKQDPTPTAQGA